MLWKKLFRTMWQYKAQFISMILMITIGVGIFVGFNMEWVSIDINTKRFFKESHFADYRVVSELGFSEKDAENVENIKGVDKVSRYISVPADVKEKDGDSLALTVTENFDVSSFLKVDGADYDKKSKDGLWISDKYAAANDISIGDKLTLVYKGITINTVVKGTVKSGEHLVCVRDETQLMPDYNTYGFGYISPAAYKKALGRDYYPQLNIISDLSKEEITDKTDEALGKTTLVLSKDENSSYSAADGEMEEGKTMGSVLPVLFLLIAVLTMVTTMHRLTAKEKVQIGTLKALGFRDKRILRHYTSYAFMIGIIGSVTGIGLGYLVARMIMGRDGTMGTYFDMPYWELRLPTFCIVILAVLILALTLIGFLSVKEMLKGTAADSLRPYAPKKMKKLLLEKTTLWNRFSFGTRWNMRDIMRHKSRTLMSLVGIAGCMVIVVGTMGMRDTMNAFLSTYYDDSMKYSSRIYLSETATEEDTQKIIDAYKGDSGATVSVQIDDKAVALDIYDITRGKVRFPAEKDGYVTPAKDGAYICMRIADKFDLAAGDTLKISPYGSDKTYNLKIAGVIRSVSENIVISTDYAKTLNIPFKTDSVYTDTKKADIKSEECISAVQSKQAIIDSFDTFMEIMYMMISILIIAAAVLGIVVLYNLGVMSYTERYREMATLKVVGFRDKKIGRLLIGQNMWVTLIGAVLGIPLGIALLDYLLVTMASEYELKLTIGPLTYITGLVITFGISLTVSRAVARKNRKIDMVEALKGAE